MVQIKKKLTQKYISNLAYRTKNFHFHLKIHKLQCSEQHGVVKNMSFICLASTENTIWRRNKCRKYIFHFLEYLGML